jgi:hypothetical protein
MGVTVGRGVENRLRSGTAEMETGAAVRLRPTQIKVARLRGYQLCVVA